jgi:hypothetical protein
VDDFSTDRELHASSPLSVVRQRLSNAASVQRKRTPVSQFITSPLDKATNNTEDAATDYMPFSASCRHYSSAGDPKVSLSPASAPSILTSRGLSLTRCYLSGALLLNLYRAVSRLT